jgi:hypothetical protein
MTTPLHQVGDLVRELFLLVPLPVARALFVAVPAAMLIWVWRLPRAETSAPGGTGRWDENLKVWASVALLLQVVIYLWL